MLLNLFSLFNTCILRRNDTARYESEPGAMNHDDESQPHVQGNNNEVEDAERELDEVEEDQTDDEDLDDEYGGEQRWYRSYRRYLGPENTEHAEVDIKRIEQFELLASDQSLSKLFTEIPGEVRDLIYQYVLADFEDMENEYELHTMYRRPEYFAPRKTDTSILRTCQAVYNEAWYMPWTSTRHTFYLTADDRRPAKTTTVPQMTSQLAVIEKLHPDTPARRKEIQQIQIFAQAWSLEPGYELRRILRIPHLLPKTVTITLRHTDMWYWESDTPIRLRTGFVGRVRFPASVTRVEMQFESTERRKAQIDYMAEQAASQWYFKRSDKIHLVARSLSTITRWTGPSTWNDERWVNDEDESLPGKLSYYMATVAFAPAHLIDDAAGYETRLASGSRFETINVPDEIADKNRRSGQGQIHVNQLEYLGATDSTPASEVNRLQSDFIAYSQAYDSVEL